MRSRIGPAARSRRCAIASACSACRPRRAVGARKGCRRLVITIRLTARDALGHRVDDLKPSDFPLTVDGKPVRDRYAVADRSIWSRSRPSACPGRCRSGSRPPRRPRRPRGGAADTNASSSSTRPQTNPFDRKDVLRRARRFIRTAAGPGNEFLVARFDGTLYKVTDWTSDVDVATRALQVIAERGQIDAQSLAQPRLGANTGSDWFLLGRVDSALLRPRCSGLMLESITTLPQTAAPRPSRAREQRHDTLRSRRARPRHRPRHPDVQSQPWRPCTVTPAA